MEPKFGSKLGRVAAGAAVTALLGVTLGSSSFAQQATTEITINPGDAAKSLSFPVHFVNPVTTARDTASNLYNDSKY